MATKQQIKSLQDIPPVAVPPEDVPPTPEEQDAYAEWADNIDTRKIQEILKANDVTGGKIRLTRKGPMDQVFQHVTNIPIEQFDLEQVKRLYGGGDYKAQTFRANGQMYRPFEFSIDYRFKGALDDQQMKQLATQPAPDNKAMWDAISKSGAANMTDMMRMMEMMSKTTESSTMLMMKMMSDSNERQMAMMQSMFSALKPAAPPIDFSTAITPILLKMVEMGAGRETSSLGAQIENLRLLKETFSGEFSKSAEPEEDSLTMKLIKMFGPLAAQMLAGSAPRQPQVGQSRQRSIPVEAPPIEPPQPISEDQIRRGAATVGINVTDDQVRKAREKVEMYVGILVAAAERDADPMTYFELINTHMQPEQVAQLKAALTNDNWITMIFGSDARIVQNREWFEELRVLILNDGNIPEQQNEQPINMGPGSIIPIAQPQSGAESGTSNSG